MEQFDIVVVGGGHAGCEAAAVAARMGATVALVSFDPATIGAMSCNPAIGGLGKGHLVREVDAFDGLIARAADAAAIHYRMLNRSKGNAVRGPRVQADRRLFGAAIRRMLREQTGITVMAGEVASLVLEGERVTGVGLAGGRTIAAGAVILCTGTFLGGRMFRGDERREGGRIDEPCAQRLAAQLRDAGLPMARMKTGTPPRLDGRTIDWAALESQPSDREQWTMSPMTQARRNPQLACAITRTNPATHAIIADNLDRSPLFNGAIGAGGPRYCPSIEDKIHRFADKDGHQVFLEPEGLGTHLVYPNGISTSLPHDVQVRLVRSIAGLGAAEIVVPGYAVEYDHLDPRALSAGLGVRAMPGLFCAGQINGTTGYEEAAAQGLVAGMHAAAQVRDRLAAPLDRGNSYIAVMIDDLTLQGVSEPYRMLTARAEYRLRLRADNATTRLSPLAAQAGCLGPERARWFGRREARRLALEPELDQVLARSPTAPGRQTVAEGLRAGIIQADDLPPLIGAGKADRAIVEELAEDAIYAPYVARQDAELRQLRASEAVPIPDGFAYDQLPGLSREMVERLSAARPATLAAAGRVPGIVPAALAVLMVHAKRQRA